jgi:hypothetical protein
MTRIFIEGYELDLTEGLSNQITYAIDDLQNLDSKNTSFTKTIILPGTTNNNKLFGNIFDFNNANFNNPVSSNVLYNFNAAKNASARIEVNGLQIMKGVLRLLEIVQHNGAIEYECSIFGELGGFVNKLGNARLEDLDFSAYDHVYNTTNIINSWDTSGGVGYYYPLIDYGNYSTNKIDFNVMTFRPALFIKEYLDKIFLNSGYTYSSTFIDSSFFKKLVIPNNQLKLTKLSDVALKATPQLGEYTLFSGYSTLQWTPISLGDFTMDAYYYDFTYNGSTIKTDINVNLKGFVSLIAGDSNFVVIQVRKNAGYVYETNFEVTSVPYNFDISFVVENQTINNGDVYSVEMRSGNGDAETLIFTMEGGLFEVNTSSKTAITLNYGDAITINQCLPKGIFQKDFFTSLLKMFNLMVTEDKYIANHLIITPYVDFWSGAVLDWSDKLDRSQAIKIKPMSEINARYYNLKFKQDNDFYNENYRKKYNEGYGDRIYDSLLEFSKDTETVEVIFASCVLYQADGTEKIYPAIYKKSDTNTKEDRMDSVVRILQIKKMTTTEAWNIIEEDGTGNLVSGLTTYGYGGHLNDPITSTIDTNFGVPKEIYFIQPSYPNANLFNVYYSPYMAEITDKDSRLLSGMFKLSDMDMFNLDFAKFIFIDGGLYRISKISDYSPETNDLTKVELLRVINKTY